MQRITVILAMLAVSLGGLALLAAPAGARVSSTSGLCKQLQNLHYTPSTDQSANGGRANATKLSKAFAKIAKKNKGQIKSTLNTMAQYFKDLAAENTTALQNDAQAFAAASQNFASYLAQSCTQGLPSGVSIPSIPTVPST